jgi:hypothetical protein
MLAVMGRGNKSCTICQAGREVAAAIETAVRSGEQLRSLEKRCGFSKSLLSKHMNRCVARVTLASTKKTFDDRRQLLWTQWPDGSFSRLGIPHDFIGTIGTEPGEDDVVLRVIYADPAPVRNLVPVKEEPPAEQDAASEETMQDSQVVQPPPASLEEQKSCQHVMVANVPGGRCQLCGLQPKRSQPRGVSRSSHTEPSKYGRFS